MSTINLFPLGFSASVAAGALEKLIQNQELDKEEELVLQKVLAFLESSQRGLWFFSRQRSEKPELQRDDLEYFHQFLQFIKQENLQTEGEIERYLLHRMRPMQRILDNSQRVSQKNIRKTQAFCRELSDYILGLISNDSDWGEKNFLAT